MGQLSFPALVVAAALLLALPGKEALGSYEDLEYETKGDSLDPIPLADSLECMQHPHLFLAAMP